MKIKQGLLVMLLTIFGTCSFAFGQWQQNPSSKDIFYTDGNVGIGVVEPGATLHVKNLLSVTSYFPIDQPLPPPAEPMITLNYEGGTVDLPEGLGPSGRTPRSPNKQGEGIIKVSYPYPYDFVLNAVSRSMPIVFQTQNIERLRISSEKISTGAGGLVEVMNNSGKPTIMLMGDFGDKSGWMALNDNGVGRITFAAKNVATGAGGLVDVMNNSGNPTIKLVGDKGSGSGQVITPILQITGGSDLAEHFDIRGAETIQPGMVVAIDPDHPGNLRIAEKAYDCTVAGVISGAGGIESGMLMGQSGTAADGKYPVALTGRVYCKADATYGQIQPGDLLTTSDTPGHSMRVNDYEKAQ